MGLCPGVEINRRCNLKCVKFVDNGVGKVPCEVVWVTVRDRATQKIQLTVVWSIFVSFCVI